MTPIRTKKEKGGGVAEVRQLIYRLGGKKKELINSKKEKE